MLVSLKVPPKQQIFVRVFFSVFTLLSLDECRAVSAVFFVLFDRSLQKLFLSNKPVLPKTAELTNNRSDPHKFADVLENSSNASKFGLRQRLRACLHGGGTPGRSGNPIRWGSPHVHIMSHFNFDHVYMIGEVTRHMLRHVSRVPHLHENRP